MSQPSENVDHYVYRAWRADGSLLYIGCSKNVEQRMRDHRSASDWFPLKANLTIEGPYRKSMALAIEREAIRSENSAYNYHSPLVAGRRRAEREFRHLVVRTAMKHGMSWVVADHQAHLACRVEFDGAVA